MRVRKTKIDQERILIADPLPFVQVIEHLLGMPSAATLIGAAPFGCGTTDREQSVGRIVTVSILARPHRVVAGMLPAGVLPAGGGSILSGDPLANSLAAVGCCLAA